MKTALLFLCVLMLSACNKPPTPVSNLSVAASTATPWDGLKQNKQHAKDVQKIIQRQAAEQRNQVEQQSQ